MLEELLHGVHIASHEHSVDHVVDETQCRPIRRRISLEIIGVIEFNEVVIRHCRVLLQQLAVSP